MSQNTPVDVILFQTVHEFDPGEIPRNKKNIMVSAAILDFFFEHTALLAVRIRLSMPNLAMIGLTVETLLALLFLMGYALKCPKIGGFGDFRG